MSFLHVHLRNYVLFIHLLLSIVLCLFICLSANLLIYHSLSLSLSFSLSHTRCPTTTTPYLHQTQKSLKNQKILRVNWTLFLNWRHFLLSLLCGSENKNKIIFEICLSTDSVQQCKKIIHHNCTKLKSWQNFIIVLMYLGQCHSWYKSASDKRVPGFESSSHY